MTSPTSPVPTPGEEADLDVEAEVSLGVQIGRMLHSFDDAVRQLHAAVRVPDVIHHNPQASGLGTAPWIDLGGPAQGRWWTVRRLQLCDPAGPGQAVAGLAFWYEGLPVPGQVPFSGQWRWSMLSLPKVDTFTGEVIVIKSPNHLLVSLSGGSAVELQAQAAVLDHPADRQLRTV